MKASGMRIGHQQITYHGLQGDLSKEVAQQDAFSRCFSRHYLFKSYAMLYHLDYIHLAK